MDDVVKMARRLRRNQTGAEQKLWPLLRNRRLLGQKFRRQYPIGRYIVDFCCLEKKLIIEIDGGQHSAKCEKDARREAFLTKQGFRIIRFWNHDVLKNPEGVFEGIRKNLYFY